MPFLRSTFQRISSLSGRVVLATPVCNGSPRKSGQSACAARMPTSRPQQANKASERTIVNFLSKGRRCLHSVIVRGNLTQRRKDAKRDRGNVFLQKTPRFSLRLCAFA